MAEPGASPSGFGVADLHAGVALVCGLAVMCFSAYCCLGGSLATDPLLLVFVLLFAGTLWSGVFALVTRGSTWARLWAGFGFFFLVLALGVGVLASCLGSIDM